MIFAVFLILPLFLNCSRFCIISVKNSGLILLYVETYAKGYSLLRFFGGWGVVVLLMVRNPLWWKVTGNFLDFLFVTMVLILRAKV